MLKKTISAAKRIVSNRGVHKSGKEFYFEDKKTGRCGVTDGYCLVMYGEGENIEALKATNGHPDRKTEHVDVSRLFEGWEEDSHNGPISRYRFVDCEYYSLKQVGELCKEARDAGKSVQLTEDFKCNPALLKDTCEAMGGKAFTFWLPNDAYMQETRKVFLPLVITNDEVRESWGLVMRMR